MEDFILYIGKAALALGAFYLAYLALFQHQKHFLFNRIYLPVSFLVSFLIPLITFTKVNYIQSIPAADSTGFAYLPEATMASEPQFTFEWYHYLLAIYALGIVVFLLNLLIGHLKAMNIIRFSRLKELFGAQVNLTKKDVHPFSFFSRIVLSEKTLKNPDLKMIVDHEMVHVREHHTIDILFAESLFLFQWFNPFAWLIRDAMRNNLEYLTDHQVAQNHNAEAYQLAMVGLAHKKGVAPFLTALNGSQLKNRIIMMKKKTENRYSLLKQLVVLPLLAILIVSLSNKEVRTEVLHSSGQLKVVVDGVELPADHPDLIKLDFTNGFEGGVVINALGLKDKVVANTLSFDKNPKEDGVYYIQTSDYVPGTNTGFEQAVNGTPASELIVKGKVTNEDGAAIFAVAVVVKGTTIGTITDNDGNYQLELEDEDATLVFSMPGYEKQELEVGDKTEANVTLKFDKVREILYGDPDRLKNEKPEFQVSGKITNEDGEGIPAVAVLVKGTTIGTISDVSGNYVIEADKNSTLQYMMLGHEKQEINIEGKSKIDVQLRADGSAKKEKVTVGFGMNNEAPPRVDLLAKSENPPLYIIDGKKSKNMDNVNADDIETISVLKGESASILYGEKGKNGVMIVTTKKAANSKMKDALIIVDGIPFKGSLDDIDPNTIDKVEVLKDEQATKRYGPVAKNGAISVKLKGSSAYKGKWPLMFLDGEKYFGDINDIDPKTIQSMDVLKDASAVGIYGEEARDGVIIISTKPEEITSELDLRKFIAKRIKYPSALREANITGESKIYVTVNNDGIVLSVNENKVEGAIPVEEVVAIAYKPKEFTGTTVLDAQEKFDHASKSLLLQLPTVNIPEYKGKTLVFTLKYVLQ
ncbi:carboxypeptidase-like regulatory domain-containing protein [Draconibacterium sp. IB214405]|uniref:carboxypeptidase-like regulatory domain-containing protein n=1 Tax=Draconibacterium sp. IB214405 TaxID=3097352 RepID=UPI002A161CDF|nr:carboxypeptidase-like regulatory domain-containing protein [Draconibacterium sp. IB214405]MDX8338095.1 carboxypeptidase-like regulatory domain-containing protein [Draconibacterium sp. IB214405]